jgi:iron complex transport system ATP-binding protein
MSILLNTQDLVVGHGERAVLPAVSLQLSSGSLVAMVGANGIGKSTLLRTMAGLQPPLRGSVLVDGRSVHTLSAMERARSIGVVLPGRPDMGMLDVRTLVSFGRQPWTGYFGRLTEEDERSVDDAMARAGVTALVTRGLRTLSDGELQQVLIARVLAQGTPITFLDEPTAFLDVVNRLRVMHLLQQVAHGLDKLVLLTTHDLQAALDLADMIILVTADAVWCGTPAEVVGQGRLQQAFAVPGMRFDVASSSFRPVGK